ncbi:MAG: hypothetical protein O3C52_06365 [Proteobacteria bacterium]|nr:hypothetical protein [Pseudomonadota bacterium]MDA1032977.1 hypothetical protein [Pseudomonadota bacterium]
MDHLAAFDKQFLTLLGADDPVTGGLGEALAWRITGAKAMPHEILNGCGHFCQEDRPAELSHSVIEMAKLADILG